MNKNIRPVVPNDLVPIIFKKSYLHHTKTLCRSGLGQRFKHTDLLKLKALEKTVYITTQILFRRSLYQLELCLAQCGPSK